MLFLHAQHFKHILRLLSIFLSLKWSRKIHLRPRKNLVKLWLKSLQPPSAKKLSSQSRKKKTWAMRMSYKPWLASSPI